MKKKYLTPESRDRNLWVDSNFLISTTGNSGEDLDDPTIFDPWND